MPRARRSCPGMAQYILVIELPHGKLRIGKKQVAVCSFLKNILPEHELETDLEFNFRII